MTYIFGNYTLDSAGDELLRDGKRVELGPLALAILKYLIEHRGRVVKKQELLKNIWLNVVVSESALHSRISELRTAFGQKRSDTQPIRTVYRVGYCFEGEVNLLGDEIADKPRTSLPSTPALATITCGSAFEPFVGRHKLIERLMIALEQAESGESRFLLLEGDAGIGKTRTAGELSSVARPKGVRVYTGRCIEQQGAPAFLPWNSALKGAIDELRPETLRSVDKRTLAQLALIVPDLAERLGDSFERLKIDAPDTNFRLYQAITRLLISASEMRACLIVLDDLHWADTASLELAAFLASQLLEGRLLIIGTLRDTELALEHPNRKSLNALLNIRVCQRVKLLGLQQQEVGQYLAQVLQSTVPESLVAALYERTSGNPFFVREAVQLLMAKHESLNLADIRPQDIELPEAVLDIVRSRLDKIDPDSRRLLEVASVVGRKFDLSVLQHLFYPKTAEVLSALEAAERSGLVNRPVGVGEYEFSHDLVAEVLYHGLSVKARARFHRRVGEVLEQHPHGELGTNELAHHFYHALPEGQYEKAVHYALAAAARASELLAHQEAAGHLHRAVRALDFHPEPDPRQQCDLLSAQATALGKAGLYEQARPVIERAANIAKQKGLTDKLIQIRILSRYSLLLAPIPDAAGFDALQYALGVLPQDAKMERCRVLAYLAWMHPNSLDMDRSQKLSSQALELAVQVDDPEVLLDAMAAKAYSLTGPDHIDELIEVTDETLKMIAYRKTFHWSMFDIYLIRLQALLQLANLAAVEATLHDLWRVALEFGLEPLKEFVKRLRMQIFLLNHGRFTEAESAFQELDQRSLLTGFEWVEILNGFRRIVQRGMQGTITVEDLQYEPALRWPWLSEIHNYRSYMAFMALAAGQIEKATGAYEKLAEKHFKTIPRDRSYITTLVDLARIAVMLNDRQRAGTLYELLKPYRYINATTVLVFYLGSVSHYLGDLSQLLGNRQQAVQHYEDALLMNSKLDHREALAMTCQSYGRLLAREPSEGAKKRARELLDAARETGQQLGIRWLIG
ncbi:MAG: AAA family ATPase [Deltaproteobacteria bacterium]|nr:AAA family ATPase [Deltaproteobacteria bacterium]